MKVKIKNNGMTLLELLIVIAIITIMVSMVFMATRGGWINANARQTDGTISLLEGAIDDYRDFMGVFPEPNALLTVGFSSPDICHSASLYFLLNSVPDSKKILERISDLQLAPIKVGSQTYYVFIDAWKQALDYRYTAGNTYPVIVSAGPDKDFAKTDDNITNRK